MIARGDWRVGSIRLLGSLRLSQRFESTSRTGENESSHVADSTAVVADLNVSRSQEDADDANRPTDILDVNSASARTLAEGALNRFRERRNRAYVVTCKHVISEATTKPVPNVVPNKPEAAPTSTVALSIGSTAGLVPPQTARQCRWRVGNESTLEAPHGWR